MSQFESEDSLPTLAELAAIEREKAFKEGREKGLKIALEQGEERSKKNFALTLLGEDFEVDYIATLTDLSVEEVEKLKAAQLE